MCDWTAMNRSFFHVVFDGSFDGFLCAIFEFYYDKITPVALSSQDFTQQGFYERFHFTKTIPENAERALNGIRLKIGEKALAHIHNAFCCPKVDYLELFQYVTLGFKVGWTVDSHLQLDYVRKIIECSSKTGREVHRYTGFTRFKQTENGVLYSAIEPDNFILVNLAEHFKERLKNEKWIIHDISRKICVVYFNGSYALAELEEVPDIQFCDEEEKYSRLWKMFYKTIAVESRVSSKRLNHLLPFKHRKHLTEFQEDLQTVEQ